MLRTFEDRRQAPRQGGARLAKIQLGHDAAPFYCIVTDTSDGGVRVHANGFHVPDEFVLHSCGPALQCGTFTVIWRHREEVGAKLLRIA
jgi:hypothetical protein